MIVTLRVSNSRGGASAREYTLCYLGRRHLDAVFFARQEVYSYSTCACRALTTVRMRAMKMP